MERLTAAERTRMANAKVFVGQFIEIYRDLEKVASNQSLTYYQKIGQDHDVPYEHNMLGPTLAECSIISHEDHGFLISALVTHKSGEQSPGPGFFEFAKSLGYSFPLNQKGREAFWIEQINRIYSHYKNK